MQATDNQWYLSHDFLGREAAEGSIFMDYRNSNDFSDDVAVVYGHRMNGDLMFSDIAKYDDENYMLNHSYGELILRGSRKIGLKANEFRRIDADDALYRNFELNGYDSAFVLSTCDRADHEKRDVLIMTTK